MTIKRAAKKLNSLSRLNFKTTLKLFWVSRNYQFNDITTNIVTFQGKLFAKPIEFFSRDDILMNFKSDRNSMKSNSFKTIAVTNSTHNCFLSSRRFEFDDLSWKYSCQHSVNYLFTGYSVLLSWNLFITHQFVTETSSFEWKNFSEIQMTIDCYENEKAKLTPRCEWFNESMAQQTTCW